MTMRRRAVTAAAIGWALTVAAALVVAAIMYRGDGIFSDRYASDFAGASSPLLLWCGLPVGMATVTWLALLRRGHSLLVWAPIGILCAFTVGAAFSFGALFAPGSLSLIVASILHAADHDNSGHR